MSIALTAQADATGFTLCVTPSCPSICKGAYAILKSSGHCQPAGGLPPLTERYMPCSHTPVRLIHFWFWTDRNRSKPALPHSSPGEQPLTLCVSSIPGWHNARLLDLNWASTTASTPLADQWSLYAYHSGGPDPLLVCPPPHGWTLSMWGVATRVQHSQFLKTSTNPSWHT